MKKLLFISIMFAAVAAQASEKVKVQGEVYGVHDGIVTIDIDTEVDGVSVGDIMLPLEYVKGAVKGAQVTLTITVNSDLEAIKLKEEVAQARFNLKRAVEAAKNAKALKGATVAK